ncbi:MAG: hypothetical protein ABW204_08850 [Microbacteriaceae bacterium]
MSEQEGAARRRRVTVNPWVLALHVGGVALIVLGIVLHVQYWQTSMLGMYGGMYGGIDPLVDEDAYLRGLATGQLALELVPVTIGAGIAAMLGGLGLQAVAWEQRMRAAA